MENSKILMQWAVMSLSKEEMAKIPSNHQRRPYLLFLDMGSFYYAFPSTSKFYNRKSRYENEELLIRRVFDGNSLVNLNRVFILPKENLFSMPRPISVEENELYKKLKQNSKFNNYPVEVMEKIEQSTPEFSWFDLIRHNGELYVIIGKAFNREIFYALKVYNCEISGTVLKIVDSNKYYVDVNEVYPILVNDTTEYVSIMHCFSFGYFEKDEQDLKQLLLSLQRMEKIKSNLTLLDYSYFGKLPTGTVISFMQDGITKKMIILKKEGDVVIVLEGLENQLYRDFSICTYPNTFNFLFTIENTLADYRVEELINSRLINNENLKKI